MDGREGKCALRSSCGSGLKREVLLSGETWVSSSGIPNGVDLDLEPSVINSCNSTAYPGLLHSLCAIAEVARERFAGSLEFQQVGELNGL